MIALRLIGRFIDGFLDRIFSVAGAVLMSQIPRFMQQYVEFLSGALFEVRKQVESIRLRAGELGMTMETFLSHHLNSSDETFVASGKIMQESLERHRHYMEALDALQHASVWSKPFQFLRYADWGLVHSMEFHPGLVFSAEGLVYGLVGLLLGFAFYSIFIKAPLTLFTGGSRTSRGRRVSSSYEPEELDV